MRLWLLCMYSMYLYNACQAIFHVFLFSLRLSIILIRFSLYLFVGAFYFPFSTQLMISVACEQIEKCKFLDEFVWIVQSLNFLQNTILDRVFVRSSSNFWIVFVSVIEETGSSFHSRNIIRNLYPTAYLLNGQSCGGSSCLWAIGRKLLETSVQETIVCDFFVTFYHANSSGNSFTIILCTYYTPH
jgi:hypothetical protein